MSSHPRRPNTIKPKSGNRRVKKSGGKGSKRELETPVRGVIEITNAVLHEKISVVINGQEMRITKLEAIFRQLINKEVFGNQRAMGVRHRYQTEFGAWDRRRAFLTVYEDNEHMRLMAKGPRSKWSETDD